jgi:hypothetical protein
VAFGGRLCNIIVDNCVGFGIQAGTGSKWHDRHGREEASRRHKMSGAWYALATIAVALVIRWYIQNDSGTVDRDSDGASKRPKRWRGGRQN